MKRECINRKSFRTLDELRLCFFEHINRYNSKHPHRAVGDYTPNEVEELDMLHLNSCCKTVSIFLAMLQLRNSIFSIHSGDSLQ